MKYSDKKIVTTEGIKAEILMLQMGIKEDVRMQGVFSRNYSEDLIGIDYEENKPVVKLSRDGVFHLLPEGLFFEENRIKSIHKNDFNVEYEQFNEEKKSIEQFFQAFDIVHFKLGLEMEKKLNDILQKGNTVFTSAFLDDQKTDSDNEYISKIKILLPFVSQLRGNLALLTELLENVFSAKKVEPKRIQPFRIQFIIHKENLSKEEYLLMDKNTNTFFDFFRHWFLPVEMECDYRIKDYTSSFTLGNTSLLDYNTHL